MKKLILFTLVPIFLLVFKYTYAVVNTSAPKLESYINNDPYENFNRNSYRMNSTIDKHFLRPVTVWYVDYVPNPLRLAINNFYNNLRDFVSLGNDILQLNGLGTMQNIMRISINSVVGIVGIIDVSSSLGLPQHKNSFGNTLKVYGWKNSSYYVIPLLGPSTVRDALGLIPDTYFNPTWYVISNQSVAASVGLFAVNGIDTRAQYLGLDQILDTSIDPYVALRDTYLTRIGEAPPHASTSNNEMNIDEFLDESNNESQTPKTESSISSASGGR